MLVKILNGEIVSIKIGELKSDEDDVFVPDEWGTDEIEEKILGKKKRKKKISINKINEENPDKKFNLLKI